MYNLYHSHYISQQNHNNYDLNLLRKKNAMKSFELLMGPALREGYWMPENYKDCGDKYSEEVIIGNSPTIYNNINSTNNLNYFIWDDDSFPNENKCTYKVLNGNNVNYPCIDLTGFSNYLYNSSWTKDKIKNRVNNLCVFFYDFSGSTSHNISSSTIDPGKMRSFAVGS